jgi:outer membrane protein TolC
MEDLYLSALDVTLQRHLFEPRPFATQSFTYSGNQKDLGYQSALSAVSAVGVRQQLPYGGEVTARALATFVDALNNNTQSGESAQLALTGTIPLLRGAGMVNLEPLINSERQLVYDVRNFEEFRRNFVVNIAAAYFRLITTRRQVDNTLTNYISTVNLTTRLLEMYAAGRAGYNFLQVQQAQTRQLQQESALIGAQESYQSAVDDFKVLLGMPVDQRVEIVPVELDVNVPDVERVDAPALALKYRLALQTARDQLDDAQRQIEVAKNGLLPGVDLTFDTTLGNRPDSPAKNIDARDFDYSAGVNIDLPIDRLAERNVYRRALISFERARRSIGQQQDQIVSDVRQSVRSVQTAQRTLDINRRAIEIAQRELDYANELLTQGRAQARDVTDALRDLLSAQNAYDRARADLQIAVLSFLRDTGTLRVDPSAGAIGRAMDGELVGQKERQSHQQNAF